MLFEVASEPPLLDLDLTSLDECSIEARTKSCRVGPRLRYIGEHNSPRLVACAVARVEKPAGVERYGYAPIDLGDSRLEYGLKVGHMLGLKERGDDDQEPFPVIPGL